MEGSDKMYTSQVKEARQNVGKSGIILRLNQTYGQVKFWRLNKMYTSQVKICKSDM